MSDILLLETNLDGHIVPWNMRRTQLDLLQSFVQAVSPNTRVFHERVETVGTLNHVFTKAAEQNSWERAKRTQGGDLIDPMECCFVHLNSHGNVDGPCLRLTDGGDWASTSEIAEAFSPLKSMGIRAIMLSACWCGGGANLVGEILEYSGAEAVVGYPGIASESVCAIAEQMLYFQLLSKEKIKVWQAVRRVNDSLTLFGVKPSNLLSCWIRNEEGELEAYPWWKDAQEIKVTSRQERSFLLVLKERFPERGSVGAEDLQLARQIVKKLF